MVHRGACGRLCEVVREEPSHHFSGICDRLTKWYHHATSEGYRLTASKPKSLPKCLPQSPLCLGRLWQTHLPKRNTAICSCKCASTPHGGESKSNADCPCGKRRRHHEEYVLQTHRNGCPLKRSNWSLKTIVMGIHTRSFGFARSYITEVVHGSFPRSNSVLRKDAHDVKVHGTWAVERYTLAKQNTKVSIPKS